ncbi:MAG: 3-dehydroquinate synthase [Desulfitobacteriia bacterium]|jgi:3-dehydroquinate synthase
MALPSIEVGGSKRYPIIIDRPLEDLGEYLKDKFGPQTHYLIISNNIVADLYGPRVLSALQEFRTDLLIVPAGEEEKSLERISELTKEAVRLKADRDTVVLALGGGVIGDLAGFFATVFFRGIRYVQIPTTFLAQVDSSIGGKVAVNHVCGKNLIGAFSPPEAVWQDYSTLETLPWVEIQNGLAETVKHAVVFDADLFNFIEDHTEAITGLDYDFLKKLAARSMAVKVRIVTEDEKEKGIRVLLNLGHTFGHALEAAETYQGITHGQGVSIGLAAASNLALKRNLLSEENYERIINLLKKLKLPTEIAYCDPQILLKNMSADKKNKSGNIVLVLPAGIGKAIVAADCAESEIIGAWKKVMK